MAKPELSDPITLRIPVDVLAQIESIAEVTDRSRSWVMVRALRIYMANEGGSILAVKQGREQIAQGDVHDFDDVLSEITDIVSGKAA